MSQITIDLDASPRVLLTAAAMLQELAGGGPKLPSQAESTEPAEPKATAPLVSEPTHAPDVVGIVQNVAPESSESQATAPVMDDVDRDGLPWDSRIHSSSKAKNADGRWKKQRLTAAKNMTQEQWDAYITRVESEIAPTLVSVPKPLIGASSLPPEEPRYASVAVGFPTTSEPVNANHQQAAQTLTPPPEDTPKDWTFITVMQALSRSGKKDEEINEVLAAIGLQKISQLGSPDNAPLCASFAVALGLK